MALMAFYRGVAFPFQKGSQSLPAATFDDDLVRMSLQQILQTQRGERPMRPQFGCDMQQYVFENNDDILTQILRSEISSTLARWEPRARLDNISFTRDDAFVTILIEYTVVATGTTGAFPVAIPTAAP
jgi:phage baseplate assembly protein W